MGAISSAINWFIGLGPIVIVTVMMFLVGLVFRVSWGKALVGGLLVGVGLQGLFLVVNMIVENLEPAMAALAARFGWSSTIVDVGWGTAGLAFGWPGLAAVYVGILAVNLVLVALRVQKTLWTDIWGMWHAQTFGACIWALTDSVVIAIVAAVIYSVFGVVLADWQKKEFQKFLNIPGISFPAGPTAHFTAMGIPVLWLLDRIPFIKDIEADVDAIRDRFGVLGEPVVMGAVVGVILGIIAGYNVAKILGFAAVVAALMVLLPRMVAILSEGLVSLTTEIVDFLRRRFTKGEEKYEYGEEPVSVSVDVAVYVGPPPVIAASVIGMPLMVLLGAILPGNQLLAITSLASVPYYLGAIMPWAKGNIVKAVLAMLIVAIPIFYTSTYLAPVYTAAFAKLGLYAEQIAAGKQVAAFGLGGGDLMAFIWVVFFRLIGLAKI
nr:PTS galactitol transporter subunit IIC [Chloroflexota bacterium]